MKREENTPVVSGVRCLEDLLRENRHDIPEGSIFTIKYKNEKDERKIAVAVVVKNCNRIGCALCIMHSLRGAGEACWKFPCTADKTCTHIEFLNDEEQEQHLKSIGA